VDHIDFDTLSNQGDNVRICTTAESAMRHRKRSHTHAVFWTLLGKTRRLGNGADQSGSTEDSLSGLFTDPHLAAAVRDEAAELLAEYAAPKEVSGCETFSETVNVALDKFRQRR
jgi:hypothetical protein